MFTESFLEAADPGLYSLRRVLLLEVGLGALSARVVHPWPWWIAKSLSCRRPVLLVSVYSTPTASELERPLKLPSDFWIGGGSLWALSLLRLQMSLLYFWAGEFKAKISWVQGSTLYRDVAILDTSPLKGLWHFIFWTEPMQRSVTTVLACSALALELLLPFLLWSDSLTAQTNQLFLKASSSSCKPRQELAHLRRGPRSLHAFRNDPAAPQKREIPPQSLATRGGLAVKVVYRSLT